MAEIELGKTEKVFVRGTLEEWSETQLKGGNLVTKFLQEH